MSQHFAEKEDRFWNSQAHHREDRAHPPRRLPPLGARLHPAPLLHRHRLPVERQEDPDRLLDPRGPGHHRHRLRRRVLRRRLRPQHGLRPRLPHGPAVRRLGREAGARRPRPRPGARRSRPRPNPLARSRARRPARSTSTSWRSPGRPASAISKAGRRAASSASRAAGSASPFTGCGRNTRTATRPSAGRPARPPAPPWRRRRACSPTSASPATSGAGTAPAPGESPAAYFPRRPPRPRPGPHPGSASRTADGERRAAPIEIERAFAAANPGLRPDMMAVACRRGALQEVRICLDRNLAELPPLPGGRPLRLPLRGPPPGRDALRPRPDDGRVAL